MGAAPSGQPALQPQPSEELAVQAEAALAARGQTQSVVNKMDKVRRPVLGCAVGTAGGRGVG